MKKNEKYQIIIIIISSGISGSSGTCKFRVFDKIIITYLHLTSVHLNIWDFLS